MRKNYHDPTLKIFSLNSNQPLAQKIAENVGTKLGKCAVRQFSDGEIQINLEESVRGDHIYLIQSTSDPVNTHLMELLIMIDALKRASAKTINIVIPYYGYARQDRTAKPHEPITAKLVANLLQKAGATRVLTLDLHSIQVQGFFDIPVDNLFTMPLFAEYYQTNGYCGEDLVVVSPKNSGVRRARELSHYLETTMAIVDQRSQEEKNGLDYLIGDVYGKVCIVIDDIINTGVTLATAVKVLAANGAREIYVAASHGLFSENAKEILAKVPINKICVTDSVWVPDENKPDNLEVITCSDLLAEGITHIHERISMSPLMKWEK